MGTSYLPRRHLKRQIIQHAPDRFRMVIERGGVEGGDEEGAVQRGEEREGGGAGEEVEGCVGDEVRRWFGRVGRVRGGMELRGWDREA